MLEPTVSAKLNRREILAGFAGAAPSSAQQPAAATPILITSAASRLAQALAAGLKEGHRVRLTERAPVRTEHEFVECALGADAATNAAVRGVEAILHVAQPLPEDTVEQQVDFLTRCTYNLLQAASEESVPRVVLLSTLEVMAGYPADFTVSETWSPRPTLGALAWRLGEFTSREFARDAKTNITVLRLGKVVRAEEVKGQPFNPLWVEERDVVHAVSRALSATLARWQILHIGSDSPRARFAVTRAKSALSYEPRFRW